MTNTIDAVIMERILLCNKIRKHIEEKGVGYASIIADISGVGNSTITRLKDIYKDDGMIRYEHAIAIERSLEKADERYEKAQKAKEMRKDTI